MHKNFTKPRTFALALSLFLFSAVSSASAIDYSQVFEYNVVSSGSGNQQVLMSGYDNTFCYLTGFLTENGSGSAMCSITDDGLNWKLLAIATASNSYAYCEAKCIF